MQSLCHQLFVALHKNPEPLCTYHAIIQMFVATHQNPLVRYVKRTGIPPKGEGGGPSLLATQGSLLLLISTVKNP